VVDWALAGCECAFADDDARAQAEVKRQRRGRQLECLLHVWGSRPNGGHCRTGRRWSAAVPARELEHDVGVVARADGGHVGAASAPNDVGQGVPTLVDEPQGGVAVQSARMRTSVAKRDEHAERRRRVRSGDQVRGKLGSVARARRGRSCARQRAKAKASDHDRSTGDGESANPAWSCGRSAFSRTAWHLQLLPVMGAAGRWRDVLTGRHRPPQRAVCSTGTTTGSLDASGGAPNLVARWRATRTHRAMRVAPASQSTERATCAFRAAHIGQPAAA
jgi:hypothetical protein